MEDLALHEGGSAVQTQDEGEGVSLYHGLFLPMPNQYGPRG